jgi:5-methyltetrahydropteroyltriglutamate--homocysteine methyltransferase
VSGELPLIASLATLRWEGQTEALTREPRDLPRQDNVTGRGVPVVRLRPASDVGASLHATARPLPPNRIGFKPRSSSSIQISTLGTSRIGPRRELRFALEEFWPGKSDETTLLESAAALGAAN